MEDIKVSNYWGVPNQFKITTKNGIYFQSYNSIIAFKDNDGNVTLGSNWDYSRTTMKYLGKFLNSNTKEIRNKLYEGIYKLNKDW